MSIYTDSRSYYKLPKNDTSGWATSAIFNVSGLNGLWAWLMHPEWNPAYGTEQWAYRYPWTMLLKTTNVYDREDRFVSYAYGDSKVRQNMIYPSSHNIFTPRIPRADIFQRQLFLLIIIPNSALRMQTAAIIPLRIMPPSLSSIPVFATVRFANVGRREVAADS